MMQSEIVIRLVLPEGEAAPDVDRIGPQTLSGLVGALIYVLWPAVAQDVECSIEVDYVLPVTDQDTDMVAPVLTCGGEFPVAIDREFNLWLPRD